MASLAVTSSPTRFDNSSAYLATLALLVDLSSLGANSVAVASADPVSVPTINILCRFSTQDPEFGTPTNDIRQDFPRLASACTSAAEPEVDFAAYRHINLFFNDRRVGSYTVTPFEQTHDGVTRIWPTSFLGGDMRTSPALIAHEMGHSFGMGHASPDDWDPLASAAMYQPLGPGYLAYHRDVAGWIPALRKADLSHRGSVTLSQLTQPVPVDMLVAYYPLPNGKEYSVEYRRQVGFDSSLPASGVIINRITPGQRFRHLHWARAEPHVLRLRYGRERRKLEHHTVPPGEYSRELKPTKKGRAFRTSPFVRLNPR